MSDQPPINPNPPASPTTDELRLADITGLYVDLANRIAKHTRISTEELTKIIASIHQANQIY